MSFFFLFVGVLFLGVGLDLLKRDFINNPKRFVGITPSGLIVVAVLLIAAASK